MIIYRYANKYFDTEAEVICNAVNCVGVYGAGLAKEFAKRYPKDVARHREVAKDGHIYAGSVLITDHSHRENGQKIILHCATKHHWRDRSKYGYVEECLHGINSAFHRLGFGSVAVPALGCGLGDLSWDVVKPMMEDILEHDRYQVFAYMPK
jgi:O-acetyl-ADP-ribose deacetylase (regulator of RNase III)